MDILNYARRTSNRAAGRHFGVQPKQIRDWEKIEDEILAAPESERRRLCTIHGGRRIFYEEAERLLADWYKEMSVMNNRGVTIRQLMDKMKEFHPDFARMNDCALRSKIERFMERQDLVLRRVNSYQPIPQEQLKEAIDNFLGNMNNLMDAKDLRLNHIYNMDQNSIFFLYAS